KALAAAKTDQANGRAEDQKQKAAAKVEELQTQLDAAKANAKSKLDAAAAAQDAAKAAETKKADAKRGKAGARAGLGLHQPRAAEVLGAAHVAEAAAGWGRGIRCDD